MRRKRYSGQHGRRAPIQQRYWIAKANKLAKEGKAYWQIIKLVPKLNVRSRIMLKKRMGWKVQHGYSLEMDERTLRFREYRARGLSVAYIAFISGYHPCYVYRILKREC